MVFLYVGVVAVCQVLDLFEVLSPPSLGATRSRRSMKFMMKRKT